MKKTSLLLLVGAAALVGAGAWYVTHQAGAPAKAAGPGPTLVSVVAPQRRDVAVLLQANGSVTPLSSVELHPQTSSTIARVHIREGQFVKAGELMFSLDARSLRAAAEKAQAQLARDQAALGDVERQYQRGLELLTKNFIAQGAVDTLKSQRDAARALLGADAAALRSAQVDAGYATLRAPLSGRVGAIGVYAGSLVSPATALTTITQLDPISVSFTLPESNLAALLAASKAGAVPVTATLAGREIKGALSFIDNSVDPLAGVIRVKAQFDNRDTGLWPGQYVNTSLTVQTLKDALVIPQNAIISNTNGVFVYAMAADHSAVVRKVTRLYAFGLNAAVSGLDGTEQVIVEGKQNLRPGAKVRLAEAAAQKGKAE
ncbi:efflux RND transporter periplasmic adaptor subunit [Janthinobacterium sp.]|uniref:efflux RND transporter periplasmic adaptor subunit n=1 Tax=Janthinobacterium sp. TaxID=1871054 RepID=UPI00293D645D|nr:efflux RND transporter periplasmic adaptor subunit [Janthinobacterium sp.]